MKVLITGASGFIGRALIDSLLVETDYEVLAAARTHLKIENVACHSVGNINGDTDWAAALGGVDVVVHVAARAHVLKEHSKNPSEEFLAVNYHGTINLAEQAVKAGVKRFIFISSIAVYGIDCSNQPLNETSPVCPVTDYGKSKLAAEEYLLKLANRTNMQVVIIRPPLVYDGEAPGNFGALLKLVEKSVPVPFRLIENRRSFIARKNLVSFIAICINHKNAADQIFVISDDEDLSTPELINFLAIGMEKNTLLIPVPSLVLKLFAMLFGKKKVYSQLCESLYLDISKARKLLEWSPVVPMERAVVEAAKRYANMRKV
jgi:nucleoside-diphosphate-sugar epimerase